MNRPSLHLSDVQLMPWVEGIDPRRHALTRDCWCQPIVATHTRAGRSYVHHQRSAPSPVVA